MKSISSYRDLVTSTEAVTAGFIWQAKEKSERAKRILFQLQNISIEFDGYDGSFDSLSSELVSFLLSASGMSQKSLMHIPESFQFELLVEVIDFDALSSAPYRDELVKRALLTLGDSLGGEMRNVVGQRAQTLLSESIVLALEKQGSKPGITRNKNGKISAIDWKERQLLFDKKPKFIGKSIDLILLKEPKKIEDPSSFLACGELKGGIDPAGADEHWKTARSALRRIQASFESRQMIPPKLFFIGSAIEEHMAKEIFSELSRGKIDVAANLNYSNQLEEAIDALISL